MRIGQYLKRQDWHDPFVASDRIRGEWIMKFYPAMEEWRPGQDYDAVIFHNAVAEIAQTKGVKILDVCDPLWSYNVEDFRKVVASVDVIVAASEEMGRQVREIMPFTPVRVIGDGHYFPFYETRFPNAHTQPATSAVWFGYADNAGPLRALLPALSAADIDLRVIAERHPLPGLGSRVRFVPWKIDTFIREISLCDFAVLPVVQPHKTNNKDISALLSGVPVAKTVDDILRLVDPLERQKDMATAPAIIEKHNAKDRAEEYLHLILQHLVPYTKDPA